jgi:hypothetical protein
MTCSTLKGRWLSVDVVVMAIKKTCGAGAEYPKEE